MLGSTKGAEAARLWIRGFKGGKTRFALPALPAGLHYLAARDESDGSYSLLLSNLGQSRTAALGLGAWKVASGALVMTEEVSETHHGDVKSVSNMPANSQMSLPMSSNSVILLTIRPQLRAAPRVLPAASSQGAWRVSLPDSARAGNYFLLALRGVAARDGQRVRVYGGAGNVSQAELLGQVTLGPKTSEVLVDVTRYTKMAGKSLIFQTTPDKARAGSNFILNAADLRIFSARNSGATTDMTKTNVERTNAVGAPIVAPLAVPEGPQPTRTVVFKTTTDAAGRKVELKLHIFEPVEHKSTDRKPAIVLFHGGGWNNGSPSQFFANSAYFASRGLVAIAPEYRVKNHQQTTPFESVADAKSAMRFVRAGAATLGIDTTRIAAAGSSAGGHLAASAALLAIGDEPGENSAISAAPNALILYNPVIDTSSEGYGNARLGTRWREISPQHHVRAGLPPTLTFHGDADEIVPYANAVAFDRAMREAGNHSELVTFPGVGHGFVYQLANKSALEATRRTDVFLASLGYLQGLPTLTGAVAP